MMEGPADPRFVVTSLEAGQYQARALYEKLYYAYGDRIKECQLDLFADRTCTLTIRANQLRLWLSSMAYVLISALRRIALAATRFTDATCGTIRVKPFKIGAQDRISVRRIKFSKASAFPYTDVFRQPGPRSTARLSEPSAYRRTSAPLIGRNGDVRQSPHRFRMLGRRSDSAGSRRATAPAAWGARAQRAFGMELFQPVCLPVYCPLAPRLPIVLLLAWLPVALRRASLPL
jgi:hypothetical protein